jgi:hypothetical protein
MNVTVGSTPRTRQGFGPAPGAILPSGPGVTLRRGDGQAEATRGKDFSWTWWRQCAAQPFEEGQDQFRRPPALIPVSRGGVAMQNERRMRFVESLMRSSGRRL